MQVKSKMVKSVSLSFQAGEVSDALDYCSKNRLEIAKMFAERDARSKRYTGTIIIVAGRELEMAGTEKR